MNGGSNRADIPADAKMVAGAVYELYTADDIYSISGNLLAAADTLLGTATTDENGLAYFDVDVPLRGESYGSSVAPTGRPTVAATTCARSVCRTAT